MWTEKCHGKKNLAKDHVAFSLGSGPALFNHYGFPFAPVPSLLFMLFMAPRQINDISFLPFQKQIDSARPQVTPVSTSQYLCPCYFWNSVQ